MEEIKKKTFEDKLTIASIKEKEINFKSKIPSEIKNGEIEKTLDSINTLRYLLEGYTFDSNATILNSEPKYKTILTEDETEVVKSKLFELIKKL